MSSGRGTILFVDDNDTLRRVLSTVLEDEGYRVLQFHSVTDARAVIDRGTAVDLALCDVVLRAGGTSREFIAHLRQVRPGLPVIVISGLAPDQATDLLGHSALPTFLQKPFTVEELLERVAALIQRRADTPRAMATPQPSPHA